jgi:hypothetical protein
LGDVLEHRRPDLAMKHHAQAHELVEIIRVHDQTVDIRTYGAALGVARGGLRERCVEQTGHQEGIHGEVIPTQPGEEVQVRERAEISFKGAIGTPNQAAHVEILSK